jgi:hypothetical protein
LLTYHGASAIALSNTLISTAKAIEVTKFSSNSV